MNTEITEPGQSENQLNYLELTQTLHRICRKSGPLSGMSRQILNEILSAPELNVIPNYLSRKTVPAGSFIWHAGDSDNSLALIVSGQVSLMKETEFKDKRIVVGLYNPITLVGEISFVDGLSRALTARATQDTEMFVLSRRRFEDMVKDYPRLGEKVIQGLLYLLSTRQRTLLERIAAIF